MKRVALEISKLKLFRSEGVWKKAALFCAIYVLCAELGNQLSAQGGTFVSFWLPAGFFLAVLLLNPTRDWPWLVLAVLPANLIFDHFHGTKFVVILLFYCANTIQAVTGAWLIRSFVAERPTLATLKEFIGLIGFAVIIGASLGAVIGAATLVHFGLNQSFEMSWEIWWGSNAMAILLLTPFILTWFSKPGWPRNEFGSPKKIAEACALLLALVVYIWLLLYSGHGIMSMNRTGAIPLLLWAGLRFGVRGATATSLLLSLAIAFFTTRYAIGLNGIQISTGKYVFPMQAVLGMASLIALIPAIVISERNRTLAELRESEERFKNLAAAAFEGIFISENGRILDVNEQGLKMFGCKRDEMIGHQIIEFIAPDWRDSIAERIRTGQETIYGHRLLRKDGSSFFAEAQAKAVRIGERMLRMTALRDITERKRAEEALQNSEALFRNYFDLAMVGCAISSVEKGMLAVNNQFCQMLGYSREELAEMTWTQFTHPDDVAADLAQFNRLLAGEIDSYILDKRFLHKDGREIFTTIAIRCVRRPDGSPDYIVGMVMDITGRKRAELEREEAVARERRTRAEYTFQLIASQEAERSRIARELHDSLGQNLLLIKNRAQLEMVRKKLPKHLREELQSISDIASQTIAEIRQISHDLRPPQLDILGLTRVLQSLIEAAGESSAIAITGKIDPVDDVFLREAATNLYRIVQESLNNILKHSRAGKARITLERDVHEVQLRIEDDGCGFTGGGEGKGLGLKNIAERVRMLDGRMKLDSQPGNGVRIEITIPISAEQG